MNDTELTTIRFPVKSLNRFFDFKCINRNILLCHSEQFQVVIHTLLTLGVTLDFHTQVITVLLPVHLTIADIEQILHTNLLTAGYLKNDDPCRSIFIFWNPISNQVLLRRPSEIL